MSIHNLKKTQPYIRQPLLLLHYIYILGGKMCVLHLYHGGVLVYRGASNRCDIHNPCIPLPNGGPDVRERNKYPICKRKCVKMYIAFLNELKTAYFIPRI